MTEPAEESRLNVRLPHGTLDAVITLAERNRRTLREEVLHAITRHLRQPPVASYSVSDEPLDVAEAEPKRRPPGRKARLRGEAA